MGQINSIYTTVSGGRVYIAADTQYIGSVASYNNSFTQFFAWLFGKSIAVNFDGKVRSVNREGYAELLCSFALADKVSDIGQRTIFREVVQSATLPTSNLKMRDVIESKDRQALFEKLALAISRGETTKALLMIGKGAELDTAYFDRERLSPSFSSDAAGLGSRAYTFTVFSASPILQAARKGNAIVCRVLKEAGANLSLSGKEYTFKREIMDVNRHLEFGLDPVWVPHHYHEKDGNGGERNHVRHDLEFRPRLHERAIVTTQDSRSVERKCQLDPIDLKLQACD